MKMPRTKSFKSQGWIIILCFTLIFLVLFIYDINTDTRMTLHFQSAMVSSDSTASGIAIDSQDDINRLWESQRNLRALVEEMACATKGIGARGGFCLTDKSVSVGGNYMWDHRLTIALENLFENQTVGDFGAGLGWYGRYWLRKTDPIFNQGQDVEIGTFLNLPWVRQVQGKPPKIKSWEGFDGAGNVEIVTNRFVRYLDLTEEHDLPVKYDWIMSLEVGEHIPKIFEHIFVENLVRHACKGIVLSWAVEGQGGHFHVNNHNNSYVKEMFLKYDFRSNQQWETTLRKNIYFGHFAETVMVFERITPLEHIKCQK